MVQSVKCPTLDFGSGHYLMVGEIEPHVRLCADGVESVWDSLFLSLCLAPTQAHPLFLSLSLKINKYFFLILKKE